MSKVIVDDELRAKLNGLNADTVFCDLNGQPLGYFVSPDEFRRLQFARAAARHTDAEVEQLRQQTGGRPLREIWKDLGAA
jgi:hypothetical protein